MNCQETRNLLLEASPGQLRGEGDHEVARHVRECPACRELARAFLEAQGELDRGLERLTASRSDVEILQTVRRELAGWSMGQDPPSVALLRRRLWRIGAPLAAAAALAAVFLVSGDPEPRPRAVEWAPAPREAGRLEEVDVQSDRRFAVMKTDDPKIHVVWFY